MATGRRTFLIITLIAFFLVGYNSYRTLTYGIGQWNLNKSIYNGRQSHSSQILLPFLVPIFFLMTYFIYRKIFRRGLKINKTYFLGHIVTSIFCLLFIIFSPVSFFMQMDNSSFSIYELNNLSGYRLLGYLLATIQIIFCVWLFKLSIRKQN
jgi:magnesium-transporting ATPase (P-type)